MPNKVEIQVFPLAKTQLNRNEVQAWLHANGAHALQIPEGLSDSDKLVCLAGKRCYKSFEVGLNPNITKIRNDWKVYLDNILTSGHGSVIEHASWTWGIENVSRVFTGELNRHRAGVAISEGSMRYIRFDNIGYWEPLSIRPNESDDETLANKKQKSRQLLLNTMEVAEKTQAEFAEIWKDELASNDFHVKKKLTSMFRRAIPMGIATGGIWTFNLRALRHIITMRTDPAAEEEIAYVFSRIAKTMCSELCTFGDFVEEQGCFVPKNKKV